MTPAKLALVHLAAKQLGLNEDVYRTILWNIGGVESAKNLSEERFERVMAHFEHLGFRWKRKNFGQRRGMATPAQIKKIRDLWEAYSGRKNDEAALNKWLEHTCKTSALRFLDPSKARDAITGLIKMTTRNKKRKDDPDTAA